MYGFIIITHDVIIIIMGKELVEKVQLRFTKMIKDVKGISILRREITEVEIRPMVIGRKKKQTGLDRIFKICKGFSRIRPEELFHFYDRDKGTRGHSLTGQ